MGIVSLILAVCFILIYINNEKYRYREFHDLLKNKGTTISNIYFQVRTVHPELLSIIDKTVQDRVQNDNVLIYNNRNKLIFSSHKRYNPKISTLNFGKIRKNKNLEFNVNIYEVKGFTMTHHDQEYLIISSGIDIYGHNKVKKRGIVLISLFFVIIIFVALAGWFFSYRALLPIRRVIEKVEQISPHNLNARIERNKNKDEIGRLINTFNNLLDRIEEAFKLQKLFVASASHQIKNPLTVITSQLEVSLINERNKEEYRKTIASVLEDIKGLNELTFQLMDLARISYSQDIPFEIIRLDDILWEVQKLMSSKYPDYNYNYSIISLPENENNLCIYGNETLLKNALLNLSENACKYSKNNTVFVSLEYYLDKLIIKFKDNGPGISQDEVHLIYEPFFRSRNIDKIKGHGIGLALVKQIMNLHQAEISVSTKLGVGTEFTLSFKSISNQVLMSN